MQLLFDLPAALLAGVLLETQSAARDLARLELAIGPAVARVLFRTAASSGALLASIVSEPPPKHQRRKGGGGPPALFADHGDAAWMLAARAREAEAWLAAHRLRARPRMQRLAYADALIAVDFEGENDVFVSDADFRVPGETYLRNGRMHRDGDLPAVRAQLLLTRGITGQFLYRLWCRNGTADRGGDNPATVVIDHPQEDDHPQVQGRCAWMRGGRLHRDGDLPAVVDVANGRFEWWVDGLQHRGDGRPAVIVFAADGRRSLEWWMHGKRHRGGGRPALVSANGVCEWWVRGMRHRRGGLPAVEGPAVEGGSVYRREWWERDKWHRAGGLPAVEIGGRWFRWFVHGKRHRADGLPAVVNLGNHGEEVDLEWYVDDRRHRGGGLPALLHCVPGLKRGTLREWWVDGKRHRDDDLPAVERGGPSEDCQREWWERGQRHRAGDRPAVETRRARRREWWIHGRRARATCCAGGPVVSIARVRDEWWDDGPNGGLGLHRANDLPAVVYRSGRLDWYREGKRYHTRHRDDDQPAVVTYLDGAVYSVWWENGVPLIADSALDDGDDDGDLTDDENE